MRWKIVARDTLIVWCFTALGGFVVGFALGLVGASDSPQVPMAIAVSDFVFGIVTFTLVGALAKSARFRHLLVVAIAAWVTSSANVLLFADPVGQWLLALPFILVVMLIGGGISFLLVRPTKAGAVSGH
jgi:hypothetical protein